MQQLQVVFNSLNGLLSSYSTELENNLLFYIKVAQSLSHFKRLLKTPSFSHLLQQHGLAFVMQIELFTLFHFMILSLYLLLF